MPFDLDVRDADFATADEGRKRVRSTMPGLTDEQFYAWYLDAKRRGARFVLVPDGVVAEYDAPARLIGAAQLQT